MHPRTVLIVLFFHHVLSSPIILDGRSSSDGRANIPCVSQDLCPLLYCGSNDIIVIIKTAELTGSKLDLQRHHLIDRNCRNFPVIDDAVVVLWPVGVGICGTTLTVDQTHAVYKNIIYLQPEPSEVIYREAISVNVSCTYPLNMNTSLGTVLWPALSYTYILVDGYGEFKVVMALFKDISYLTPYQVTELQLSTRETLYVGVFIAEGDSTAFKLVMKNCFATPTNNWNDPVKYYMIQNRCPNSADGTVMLYENGLSSNGKFSVRMFKFIGDYSRVYLHCEVYLCYHLDGTSCVPVCPAGNRDGAAIVSLGSHRTAQDSSGIVSFGPIGRSEDSIEDGVGKATNWNIMTLVGFILATYMFL
uniref:ZP domain-containing protein n=1 Tax=Leptobrachium leishanense TaxID=445787 RepID=A0A8C5Q4V5_9ANUR